jgi:hypothetical protein
MERFARIQNASTSVCLRATGYARFRLFWAGSVWGLEASSRRVGKAWISLDSLVRIEPFQLLTREFGGMVFVGVRRRRSRLAVGLGEIVDDAVDLVEQALPFPGP